MPDKLQSMLCHLQDLLDSIGILSTGHLPPELFPPTVLQNVTADAIEMVCMTHPDVHSMLERQIRLYEWLLCHLQDLLDSIGILSTGHFPCLSH